MNPIDIFFRVLLIVNQPRKMTPAQDHVQAQANNQATLVLTITTIGQFQFSPQKLPHHNG